MKCTLVKVLDYDNLPPEVQRYYKYGVSLEEMVGKYGEMYKWIRERPDMISIWKNVYFNSAEDRTAFILRWCGE